jgi:hypothetical protein
MRRATISIPDELERAIEMCRRDLEVSPSLAAITQTALREYLFNRGYLVEVDTTFEDEFIPSSAGKPSPLENAPENRGETVSDAVIEDRR